MSVERILQPCYKRIWDDRNSGGHSRSITDAGSSPACRSGNRAASQPPGGGRRAGHQHRQSIQTVLSSHPPEAIQGLKTETTDAERRLMNQVLAELGVQFTSKDIFERAKKLKPGMKRDFLKRAVIRLELSGAIRKIETGRGRRPARYQKRFFN